MGIISVLFIHLYSWCQKLKGPFQSKSSSSSIQRNILINSFYHFSCFLSFRKYFSVGCWISANNPLILISPFLSLLFTSLYICSNFLRIYSIFLFEQSIKLFLSYIFIPKSYFSIIFLLLCVKYLPLSLILIVVLFKSFLSYCLHFFFFHFACLTPFMLMIFFYVLWFLLALYI